MTQPLILVVDDEQVNLQLMRTILDDHYRLAFATNGPKALDLAVKHKPDLILLDIMMPEMDGYEVCSRLKSDPELSSIPVIFTTAMESIKDETRGFDLGAVDYIKKPVHHPIVLRRVKTQLSLTGVNELEKTRMVIIQQLGRAAEFKDNETGRHVIRMSHYSRIMAEKVSTDTEWSDMLHKAAILHDIGKIGIPDHILLKPGPLDEDEWKVMRRHPKMGIDIIGVDQSPLFQLSGEVAFTHHEKWDGSGYPRKLSRKDIPLSGRIVAIADVFDALSSKRPYKDPWPMEKVMQYIQDQSGQHFDPELAEIFLDSVDEVNIIKEEWREPD